MLGHWKAWAGAIKAIAGAGRAQIWRAMWASVGQEKRSQGRLGALLGLCRMACQCRRGRSGIYLFWPDGRAIALPFDPVPILQGHSSELSISLLPVAHHRP